jgi:hypothetical protein
MNHPLTPRDTLKPGLHRPIYLWAGPGTIRMNRLKFMQSAVDEAAHFEAHTPAGAQRVVTETGCHWAYLMYNWGFPPEVEEGDWRSFGQAVQAYHAAGARVFAYIQTSNCVHSGSFVDKDWYALDPRGRKVHYYTGRYMTCWESPEWLAHLRARILDALARGADGIFFDNPWHGAQPVFLGGAWLGPAGCYCAHCRALYAIQTGHEIPLEVIPGQPASDEYLTWRAARVTQTLFALAEFTRANKADVIISANDFDAVMRPSTITYGIHLADLARIQDIVMIEDYGLPKWIPSPTRPRMINNALTLRTARALAGSTPLSVDAYDHGIGFDSVFPARRYQQAIAEATACQASAVIKGTEFVDQNGVFTLLTALPYTEIRTRIGEYHNWLADRSGLLNPHPARGSEPAQIQNLAPVGLLYPDVRLWETWPHLARRYFGCGQTLIAAGIPWRAVTPGENLEDLKVLLVLDMLDLRGVNAPPNLPLINITALPGWQLTDHDTLLESIAPLRHLAARLVGGLMRAYFSSRFVRRSLDGLGMMRLFTDSHFYDLPLPAARRSLLETLPAKLYPQVDAEVPVLIEVWKHEASTQVHLVNYAPAAQRVTLHFPTAVRARLISPDRLGEQTLSGQTLRLTIDIYAILVMSDE